MDTERWQILCKAIDSGSLRGAAEQMGYTVSGISRSVATLEAELGFSLLHRAKTGVKPTAECEKLMPAVRELLFAQERVEQTAARIKGAEYGTIVIGTAYSSYYRWISTVTQGFRQKHPGAQYLHFHHTQDGCNYLFDEDGFWRLSNYVPSVTYDS